MRRDFTPFISKSFQIWDHCFPLFFPKDYKNPKSLDIGLQEVGVKRLFNGVNKLRKKSVKKVFQRQFYTLYEQKLTNLRPLLLLLFPQGFHKYKKKFGRWALGSEDKKTVKRSEKHHYQKKSSSVRQNFAQKQTFCCAVILHIFLIKVFFNLRPIF